MISNIFYNIGAGLVGLSMIVGGWFGYNPTIEQNFGASSSTPSAIALFETTLASGITSTATSFTLTSATDKDGTALASSTYGFIIDEGTSVEEMVLADCTSTACTNVTRGLSVRTGTSSVTSLKFAHRRGASIKITDGPALIFAVNALRGRQNIENQLKYDQAISVASSSQAIPSANWVYSNMVNTSETQTINGAKTLTATTTLNSGALVTSAYQCTSGSSNLQLCDKAYIDGVAVAGASNANTTTKGIVEQATVAEVDAGTATGGTGAVLFVSPDALAVSTIASTTQTFATTSVQNLATTTIRSPLIPTKNTLMLDIVASSTGSGNADVNPRITFNGDFTATYAYDTSVNWGGGSAATAATEIKPMTTGNEISDPHTFYVRMIVNNIVGEYKYGTYSIFETRPGTVSFGGNVTAQGIFLWKNTGRITQIDLDFGSSTVSVTAGSKFKISGY